LGKGTSRSLHFVSLFWRVNVFQVPKGWWNKKITFAGLFIGAHAAIENMV
jgi:hypothetical protein